MEVVFGTDKVVSVTVTNHVETASLADPALTNVPAALTGAPSAEEVAKEMTADVIVVGAGMAGMAAALSAQESGAKVILIDKMAAVGGTTNVVGGLLAAVDAQLFEDDQMPNDDLEKVIAFWGTHMAQSGVESGYPDQERLADVLADTGATVDWYVANGIEFADAPYAGSPFYPVATANGGGAGLIKMLEACVVAKGVELITECKATELVTDEAGAVVGVIAETAMFLKALTVAPFYAVKVYPTTFGSAGGVTTTADGRVTTQAGDVIPGLYAAGEMINRYLYNENYILAASLGLYSTMGRRAGAAATQDAPVK